MFSVSPPAYLSHERLTGDRLAEAELAMLRRLGRGELAFQDCAGKAAYSARAQALSGLQHRGWIDAERRLTERGCIALDVFAETAPQRPAPERPANG